MLKFKWIKVKKRILILFLYLLDFLHPIGVQCESHALHSNSCGILLHKLTLCDQSNSLWNLLSHVESTFCTIFIENLHTNATCFHVGRSKPHLPVSFDLNKKISFKIFKFFTFLKYCVGKIRESVFPSRNGM